MRILVTGGAGFVGSHLVEALVAAGVGEIVVIDNLHRGRLSNLQGCWDRIEFVQADVRDAESLQHSLRAVDVVYHLAAQSTVMGAVDNLEYSFSTNVVGTFHLLQAAYRQRVKRFVFASSREVYGEAQESPTPETAPLRPKNAYGASKVAGELYCDVFAKLGLDAAILRFTNVYGPRDEGRVIPNFIASALRGIPLTVFGGDQVLDFVWVGTVVDALVMAGLGEPIVGPLNVGSGQGTTIVDLARRVLDATSSPSRLDFVPGRGEETVRFVADTARACAIVKLPRPVDPLSRLNDVVLACKNDVMDIGQAGQTR